MMKGKASFYRPTDTDHQHDPRYTPLYTLAEVNRYARVHAATLRAWADKGSGVLTLPAGGESVSPFSFINLVEAHVLVALRHVHRVPMQRIRSAVDWLGEHFRSEHPLAEVDLETDGYDLFARELGIPVNASQQGQSEFPEVLNRYLQRIERDAHEIPVRFFPFTTNETCPKTIVMDPTIAYGRPVINGTRISTVMVFERFGAGESHTAIASDYDLELPGVEEAIRCEMERRAA